MPAGCGRRRRRDGHLEGRSRRAHRAGEAGLRAQKQQFPKAGTPEYQSIQTQYVAYLVELAEFRQAAEKLGGRGHDEGLDAAEQDLIKSRFSGKRAEYVKALKQQGFTPASYRAKALEVSALSKKIFDEVTKDVEVSEQDILAYYTQNQAQYGTPESRDVRHILIAIKDRRATSTTARARRRPTRSTPS